MPVATPRQYLEPTNRHYLSPFTKVFDIVNIKNFLAKRFLTTDTRQEGNQTKRTDKYSSLWNTLRKKLPAGASWDYLLHNRTELLETWKTASTRQTALSMLRVIMTGVGGLSEKHAEHFFRSENKQLMSDYVDEACQDLPENGMTFDMADSIKSDIPQITIYFKLMSGSMPVLRIGDWFNATYKDDGIHNWLNLKDGYLLRRISKNKSPEISIPISPRVYRVLKKNQLGNRIFGEMTAEELAKKIKDTYPNVDATPRYFRRLYATEIIPEMNRAENIIETLNYMDQSLETFLRNYCRLDDPIYRVLKNKLK